MRTFVVDLLVGFSLLLVACGPSSSGGDATGLPDASGEVGTDLLSGDGVPVTIASGGLAQDDAAATALGRAWTRATSAAVHAVVVVDSLVLQATPGLYPFTDGVKTARTALDLLEAAGADLADLARAALPVDAVVASALSSTGLGAGAEGEAALALATRDAGVYGDLAAVGDALVAEAARARAALAPLLPEGAELADLAALPAALAELRATAPVVLVAGGVTASMGHAAGAPVPGADLGSLRSSSASQLVSLPAGGVVLSAEASAEGVAGAVPLAGEGGALALRGDGRVASAQDRAVGLTPTEATAVAGEAVSVLFATASTALVDATTADPAAACWLQAAPDPSSCAPAASPFLAPGGYQDPVAGWFYVDADKGLSPAVARQIRAGLDATEITAALPADPDPRPAPHLDGMSPMSGAVGTSITLTGTGFGTDPSRVVVTISGGLMQKVAPSSLSDTSLTFTLPAGWYPPPLDHAWCVGENREVVSALIWITVNGVDGSADQALYFEVTDLPPCPPSIQGAPWPAVASPGDEVALYGVGFAKDPAQNLIELAGRAFPATGYAPDPYLEYDGVGTLTFVLPVGAQGGHLRVKRLDGLDIWSEPVDMGVQPATVPVLAAGDEADGLFVPCWAIDQGQPTESVHCVGHSWFLGGASLLKLRGLSDLPGPGQILIDVTTRRGTAGLLARVLADDRVLVNPPGALVAGLEPGETVTFRARGYELFNFKERVSEPLTLTVGERLVVGRAVWVDTTFSTLAEWQKPLQLARGDVLAVQINGSAVDHVLTAPGLWEGALDFGQAGTTPADVPNSNMFAGRAVRLDVAGAYTVTNQTTGSTLPVEVQEEGTWAGVGYGWWDTSPQWVGVQGARFGCGGVDVTIPPGALPVHDGVGGAYTVTCQHHPLDALGATPGLPQLTAGSYLTKVIFDPEPAELLKPVTIVVPFTMEGRTTPPEVGLMDPASGLYAALPADVDEAALKVTLTLPAGTYAAPPPATIVPGASFPKLSLNTTAGSIGVFSWKSTKGTLTDDERKLQVQWVDGTGAGQVSQAFAEEVFETAVRTWDFLTGRDWPAPDGWMGGWVTLTIADLGSGDNVKGSTTKGVFGQPWVTINSNLASGKALKTTVSHEMGHVFQRQLTTNFSLKWIDEASANWIAVGTLGSDADISADIAGSAEFPAVAFPGTFGSGYDEDQGYAAGAWAVWLEEEYEGSILKLYQALQWGPGAWADAWSTLAGATGKTMSDLTAEFATAYWTQTLGVVHDLSLSLKTWTLAPTFGVTLTDTRPGYSSLRHDLKIPADVAAEWSGRDPIVRATGLSTGVTVDVYSDTGTCGAPVTSLSKLVTLFSDTPRLRLPAFAGTTCYRVLITNFGSQDSGALTVRLALPTITSLAPTSGKNDGGYPVTISGTGFGAVQGQVSIAGFPLTVTSWTDTAITVTMLNAGTQLGFMNVKVLTDEQAWTNAAPFTFVD